tara:strand:+ start:87 stop:314 length:228 start_codon:yes stop_codon:yes gene_type:complete
MDTVIKDVETNRSYCLVGDTLFCAFNYKDGSVNNESWHPIDKDLTLYHRDMIEKLRNLANTTRSLHAPIADFPFL